MNCQIDSRKTVENEIFLKSIRYNFFLNLVAKLRIISQKIFIERTGTSGFMNENIWRVFISFNSSFYRKIKMTF